MASMPSAEVRIHVKEEPENTMAAMLDRAAARVKPATIIDVGASDGRWAAAALARWPGANVLCIEADERHLHDLVAFCKRTGGHLVAAMAGAHVGTGYFAASPTDPWGGQGVDVPRADTVEMPCTTVDHEITRHWLPGPYLLKLDTHGYEAQILAGAEGVLRKCCALVIEAYTCTLQPGALRFWELCRLLSTSPGRDVFVPTDIADVMRRPLDGRWWQCDLLFERAYAPLVGEPRYR